MYTDLAAFYDRLYAHRDYKKEATALHVIIKNNIQNTGSRLLDVACGTGNHLLHLREFYDVEGVDSSEDMLAIAKKKLPGVIFHHSSLPNLNLDTSYDVIISMFGSINYMRTESNIIEAIRSMTVHLAQGGVLIIEPAFFAETYHEGKMAITTIDDEDLKMARISTTRRDGDSVVIDFHFLVGHCSEITYRHDPHTLGLFPKGIFIRAMKNLNLTVKAEKWGYGNEELLLGIRI